VEHWFTNIIHCCDLKGDEIWTYQDKSIVNPRGLSVDNNHNVFVVGLLSHGLSLIQNDGKVSRTLLTETDGLHEEFEDAKGAIRIRISKKNRQHKGQKKKDKRTNNDPQNITHKTKDRVTRTPL
jgi:hypothetical protein